MNAAETAATAERGESRVERRFAALRAEGRGGLVTFITAGDPDGETSFDLLCGLPAAGADAIELGMPFSDPMADGPAIQAASLRAIEGGMTLARTLDMVRRFRARDAETPIILMGYANPVLTMGEDPFCQAASEVGVDGIIVVDLPPEEGASLFEKARGAGIDVTSGGELFRAQRAGGDPSRFVYSGVAKTDAEIDAALKRLPPSSAAPLSSACGPRRAGVLPGDFGIALRDVGEER